MIKLKDLIKEDYISDTLTTEYDNRNKDWDVVTTQAIVYNEPFDEVEESKMRSKALLIIAHNGGGYKVWNRVIKRFISNDQNIYDDCDT